jgi:hypothetical protein
METATQSSAGKRTRFAGLLHGTSDGVDHTPHPLPVLKPRSRRRFPNGQRRRTERPDRASGTAGTNGSSCPAQPGWDPELRGRATPVWATNGVSHGVDHRAERAPSQPQCRAPPRSGRCEGGRVRRGQPCRSMSGRPRPERNFTSTSAERATRHRALRRAETLRHVRDTGLGPTTFPNYRSSARVAAARPVRVWPVVTSDVVAVPSRLVGRGGASATSDARTATRNS